MKKKITSLAFALASLFFGITAMAQRQAGELPQYVSHKPSGGAFQIFGQGKAATIVVDTNDWAGVVRAARDLGDDVRKVTGTASQVVDNSSRVTGRILIGTIGKSRIIDRLVAQHQIDISSLKGKWESFLIQTVGGNLVIAGSDKRGTIYGIYDVSEKIGVSPWYWWANAPVQKSRNLFVLPGRYVQASPKVKYRGIFINDEDPSFGGWAKAKFGGVNSKLYVHLFELLLRLKANFLWPAMWGKSFNEDDPADPILADSYGIVMGTSHHEPMMRAQKEYSNHKQEVGPWDYINNEAGMKKYFNDGLERNKSYENLITIGMRGDGDVPLGKGDDEENIRSLRKIIAGQREIIGDVYHRNPAEVPQVWAIFTEVQRYYDAGLTVPDDVTLLFCDNNWGYIRRTVPEKEKNRKGGLGLYYHIDMNGGPWNDRWINTTTIPKLREQFNLAYQSGIRQEWIVNVGDLKPKELPIDFIMHYAWNPDAYPADGTDAYTLNWAGSIFGKTHAREIADIVSKYAKYNLWRKPEVQDTRIFSFVNYHEADRVYRQWQKLAAMATVLERKIPAAQKDAFYELVLYPAKASAGVAEMYLDAGRNQLYARQGRVSANDYAARAHDLFELDKQLAARYNDSIAGGKWQKMMSDVHIGYTRWSMPRENKLPELSMVSPLLVPTMGVAVEGSEQAWPGSGESAALPVFDNLNKQQYDIDLFNRGIGTFSFTARADKPWIKISQGAGKVEKETRLKISIDWNRAPEGKGEGQLTILQESVSVPVIIRIEKRALPHTHKPYFGSFSGEFSIPAQQFNANLPGKNAKWIKLPDLGRSDACMGVYPVTAPSAGLADAPRLEYTVLLPDAEKTTVCLGILPTQDINPARGLRIAVALDNGEPVILDARKGFVDTFNEYTKLNLERSPILKPLPPLGEDYALVSRKQPRRNEIFDNIRWLNVDLSVKRAGLHRLKIYMVDPEIVLERMVINPDNRYPSYFGAPSKIHIN